MKPNTDMITKILHNFRVNGRFNQDQLIIGRGQEEQLQLMIQEGTEGIGCLTFNGMTFYRRVDLDQQLSIQCNTAYANSKDGTPTATLYCSNSLVWYGNNYYYAGSKIGDDVPTWEANGGTIDSPEGTVWGSYGGSDKPYTSTFEMIDQTDPIGIRYTPGVTGERTFTILGTTEHPVFDETVTLYPYSKPVNDFTNSWVLAEEDVVWISDKFTDPDFPGTRYIMYIGGANGPMPNQWRVHTIGSSDTGIYGVNWDASNTPDFLGSQENVTWNNGEASAYPSSVNDWSTSGYQGVQPESFSMTNTEGSDPKLEYTNDGSTWYEFGGQGSASLTYEPIEFDQSHLSSDGKITIQHDFNNKNVLCLGCTPQPKEIEYLDNQIVLDYSDQNSSNLSGAVWFVNSAQSMLVAPGPDHTKITVTGAGFSNANGVYTKVEQSAWGDHLDANQYGGVTEGTMWVNDSCVIFDRYIEGNRSVFIQSNKNNNNVVRYLAHNIDPDVDTTTATYTVAAGPAPVPTLVWGGGN